MPRELSVTIENEQNGLSVKAVLTSVLRLSRHEISRLKFTENGITLNGRQVRTNQTVSAGDILSVCFPEKPQEAAPATPAAPVQAMTDAPRPYLLRKKTGEKIYIKDEDFKIGKSQINADYTISENQAISRVHCIVRRKNGVTFIEDNNSTNGTFVDGQKLEPHKEQFLKVGSVVKLGDEEFEFFLR